jgi:hypothetical protein
MQTVVGLFESKAEVESAIRRLQAAGFDSESIGVAMRDRTESGELAEATGAGDLTEEGAAAGAVSGAGLGILIGLALVGSTIVLPGVGPFVVGGALAGGPLAAALAGAGIGAVSGGLIGGLVGSGIPEDEAEHYASGLERGGILVSVRVPDDRADEARRILDEEGARRTTVG